MKNRTAIIQHLIDTFKYKNYLEIGVRNPASNYERIKVDNKHGVDPSPRRTYENECRMTSDDFFEQNDMMFDLIFIDGDHRMFQTDKDVVNALKCITDNGTIVLHDCSPLTEERQVEEYIPGSIWNGSVWKTIAKLRCTRDDLNISVVNKDHGVGVIRKGKQITFKDYEDIEEVTTFVFLDKNRKKLLNLISPKEFIDTIKNNS